MKKNLQAISLAVVFVFTLAGNVYADLPGWGKRQTVSIDNSSNSNALTNHQILVTLDTQTLIANGDLQADGDDIRFTDTDTNTLIDYWIESGINTTNTRVWVEVPSILASSTKDIFFFYDNPNASAASSLQNTMVLGEVGTATVSASYSTVNFLNTYSSAPAIVASHIEGNQNEEVSVRIRNVGTGNFQVKLHHPSGSSFNANTVNYLVMESGDYITIDGIKIEARTFTETSMVGRRSGSNNWSTRTFNHTYTTAPVVFTQTISENDAGWITEAVRNVSTTTAQTSKERAEVNGGHSNETQAMIVMEVDENGQMNNIEYETHTSGDNVLGHGNGNYTTNFNATFNAAPLVISDQRRRDGGDGGWVAIESIGTSSFSQHIEEDRTLDTERNHTSEDTSIIVLETSGQLAFRKFTDPQPTVDVQFPISQLGFTTSTQTLSEDQVSNVITVQTQDQFGFEQNATSNVTVNLSSNSSAGQFSLTSSPFTPVTSVTISSGTSTANFYYRDGNVGNPTITATASGESWDSATQQFTIEEVVLRGAYKVAITIDNTSCTALTDHQVLLTIDTQTPISEGKMQTDGDDIRFTDSDDSTSLNYWLESGINTASTRVWVKIPSVPSGSSKQIFLYYGNSSATAGSSLNNTMELGEVGQASVTNAYSTVSLTGSFTSPVVMASPVEGADNDEASTRVRNVSSGSFQIKLQHPEGTSTNGNTAYYFVLESGRLSTLDGSTLIEAATYTATNVIGRNSSDNSWGSISFGHSYSSTPLVFSQVQTENDTNWITEAIRNVNTSGAQSSMELAEVSGDHADETMGWVAVENNESGTNNSITFVTQASGDNVLGHNNGNYARNFSSSFSSAPMVLTDMRRRDGGDGGWVVTESVSSTAVTIHIEEDQVGDSEKSHTSEDVSIMAYSGAGQLIFRKFVCSTQPSSSSGSEQAAITQLVFTTSEQTIRQNEISSVMTVQTQDFQGNPLAVTSDTILDLTSSSSGGEFSDSASFTSTVDQITISSGQNNVEFYYRDTEVGTPQITVSENPSQGWTDAVQDVTVLSGVNSFSVVIPSTNVTETSFSMTVTALDDTGGVSTSYNEATALSVVYVSPSSGSGALSTTVVSSFVNGVATIPNQTFSDCGTIAITAAQQSDSSNSGTSNNGAFAPSGFELAFEDIDDSVESLHTVNKGFGLNVTAQTPSGATCVGYQGPATLSVNSVSPTGDQGGALTPTDLSSGLWASGVANLDEVLYDRWGEVNVTATDNSLTTQSGTSSNITFLPKDFGVTVEEPPLSRSFFYNDEPFDLTVTARDESNTTIENYQGTITFSGASFNLPDDFTFSSEDLGTITFDDVSGAIETEGATITVSDSTFATVTGESDSITIKEAFIQAFSNQGPIGPLAITVSVVDTNGDVIIEDDSTTFTVTLEEVIEDDSAESETTTIPLIMTAGSATVTITDNQAENVEVTPVSSPVLDAVSGTATFGTLSGTGLGVQIYRELKDSNDEE